MKVIPALGFLLYPILISSVSAQPPLLFPPQVPIQPIPLQAAPLQAAPIPMQGTMQRTMQRTPYIPQPAYPPTYAQRPQFLPPSQGMPAQAMPSIAAHQQARIQRPHNEYSGYLGLITDLVPSSVIAQLPDGITQGILFKGFSAKSPASSSDLKPYDVIFSYDEKKLNHPAQLIKIIRNDKPGRTVSFKVVRKGKILKIPVTLGAQKTPNPKDINGLEIKQFGEDKFRAIVHFLGPNGNKQLRSFQGTREDIFNDVRNATGLPQAERQQLLYAMRPRKGSNNGFGSFMPFGGNNGSKDWKFMDPGKYFKW